MSRAVRFFLGLAPVLLLASIVTLGISLRPAAAGPCKTDGTTCNTNQSCCGTNGHNGVCVKAKGAKFGSCCTPDPGCPAGDVCVPPDDTGDGCGGVRDCPVCGFATCQFTCAGVGGTFGTGCGSNSTVDPCATPVFCQADCEHLCGFVENATGCGSLLSCNECQP